MLLRIESTTTKESSYIIIINIILSPSHDCILFHLILLDLGLQLLDHGLQLVIVLG